MSSDTTPPHAPGTIPARTKPTWEMELLISGATVFGLMQMPGLADKFLFHVHNTGAEVVSGFVLPLWIYVKSALVTLIATFVAHLALRGYWIALVGLSSVYPDGIRWAQVAQRTGPFMLAWMKERFGDIDATIERADNRATRVFGVGFAVATLMQIPIGLVLVLPAHYDSQRGDGVMLVPVPTIPDPVVRGPYLRLFIPYFPRRHGESMRSACPGMLRDDADARARLACLQSLHAVAIDGVPVDVPFDAAEDPLTGQRGMLAMIPMVDVAPGRHELTVSPAPLDRDRAEGADPITLYRIPFWR